MSVHDDKNDSSSLLKNVAQAWGKDGEDSEGLAHFVLEADKDREKWRRAGQRDAVAAMSESDSDAGASDQESSGEELVDSSALQNSALLRKESFLETPVDDGTAPKPALGPNFLQTRDSGINFLQRQDHGSREMGENRREIMDHRSGRREIMDHRSGRRASLLSRRSKNAMLSTAPHALPASLYAENGDETSMDDEPNAGIYEKRPLTSLLQESTEHVEQEATAHHAHQEYQEALTIQESQSMELLLSHARRAFALRRAGLHAQITSEMQVSVYKLMAQRLFQQMTRLQPGLIKSR